MNEIKIFESEEFGQVRAVMIDDEPYFVGKDVAEILGYKRTADAISTHCKGSVKYRVLTNGGEQNIKCIPEGDLYRLVAHSKLPQAEKFERWVFDEILPLIRKYGAYMTDETINKGLKTPDTLFDLVNKLKEEREKGKNTRLNLTEVLKNSKENERMHGHAYSTYTNCIYKAIFGMNTSQLRKQYNIGNKDNLRDYFSFEDLQAVRELECMVIDLLMIDMTYDDIKVAINQTNIKRLAA